MANTGFGETGIFAAIGDPFNLSTGGGRFDIQVGDQQSPIGVPAPGTVVTLGLGLIVLGISARRARRPTTAEPRKGFATHNQRSPATNERQLNRRDRLLRVDSAWSRATGIGESEARLHRAAAGQVPPVTAERKDVARVSDHLWSLDKAA